MTTEVHYTAIPAVLECLDERFARVGGDSVFQRLFCTGRWTEGPVYHPASRGLTWSDIPNDRLLRWDEHSGQVSVFRTPSGYANGGTLDAQGRLISCEQGNRRVTRTEYDGSLTVLADRCEGRRFNSPNDVVVRRDGSVWFTDPSYGIDNDYEGVRAESEQDGCHVYRIDPDSGTCQVVADDFVRPNGLAFSLDERQLYIVDTRRNHIRVCEVKSEGQLNGGNAVTTCSVGIFDGIRLDAQGRIWAAAGDGVHCFEADGTLIGKLRVPEPVANLTFGGLKRNQLFICATTSVYSILLNINGAPPPYLKPQDAYHG